MSYGLEDVDSAGDTGGNSGARPTRACPKGKAKAAVKKPPAKTTATRSSGRKTAGKLDDRFAPPNAESTAGKHEVSRVAGRRTPKKKTKAKVKADAPPKKCGHHHLLHHPSQSRPPLPPMPTHHNMHSHGPKCRGADGHPGPPMCTATHTSLFSISRVHLRFPCACPSPPFSSPPFLGPRSSRRRNVRHSSPQLRPPPPYRNGRMPLQRMLPPASPGLRRRGLRRKNRRWS